MTYEEARTKIEEIIGLRKTPPCHWPLGLTGTGIGKDHVVVLCLNEKAKSRFQDLIEARKDELGGIPVQFRVTGQIRAL